MKKENIKYIVYIMVFLVVSLIPLVLLPVMGAGKSENNENGKGAEFSDVIAKPNIDIMKKSGEYFDGHFALRQQMVTANSLIKTGIFRADSDEDVIVGKDGWLFYKSTLPDYLKKNTLSDNQINMIKHNVNLIHETLKKNGTKFVFTIAPNKNSLYPQNMPEYLVKNTGTEWNNGTKSNAERLCKGLDREYYLDLFEVFRNESECLYHKTDSHWNNKGALKVAERIMEMFGGKGATYGEPVKKNDFTGDLYHMIYPSLKGDEQEFYYDKDLKYKYDKPINSTYDENIFTTNENVSEKEESTTNARKQENEETTPNAGNRENEDSTSNAGNWENEDSTSNAGEQEGTLGNTGNALVCRDSFGNSLLPFLANEFNKAHFTREIPYPLYEAKTGDCVILEVVERHLHYLCEYAPILPVKESENVINVSEKAINVSGPDKIEIASIETNQIETDQMETNQIGTDRMRTDVVESISTGMLYKIHVKLPESIKESIGDKDVYISFSNENGSKVYPVYYVNDGVVVYIDMKDISGSFDTALLFTDESGKLVRKISLINNMRIENTTDESASSDVEGKSSAQNDMNSQDEGMKTLSEKELRKKAKEMIGKDIADLIKEAGKADEESLAPSCETEGEDGIYTWGKVTVYTQSENVGGTQIIKDVE